MERGNGELATETLEVAANATAPRRPPRPIADLVWAGEPLIPPATSVLRWPALWTFTHVEGVEPTNNRAERGLRGAVIYRKLSLGSQSEQGERTIERLLSASITCRLQGRSLFAYLSNVLTASIRGDPIPLLT